MVARGPGAGDFELRGGGPASEQGQGRDGAQGRGGTSYRAAHGVGSHLEPSASFLNCELLMNGCWRYFGSSRTEVTSSAWPPPGSGARSKYSVRAAFSL